MVTTLADRVLKVLEEMPLGTHLCHFYQAPQDMLDVLVPYFATGIRRGEKCLWIVDQALSVEGAKRALAAAVPDLGDRLASGQVEFVRHTDWYLVGGRFDEGRVLNQFLTREREALAAGYGGVRVTGNTLWARGGLWDDLLDYERHVDRCFSDHRISAICCYSLDRCSAADIADVAKAHELVLIRRGGAWDVIESSTLRHMRRELHESHERLKALAHQMVEVEQRERRRISRVLHDGLQQTIVAARLNLAQAADGIARRDPALRHTDELLVEAMRECRTLTTEISPPILHEGGLVPALQWLAAWFEQQHRLRVRLDVPVPEPPLGDGERVFLFEAARELLFNVVKHAGVDKAAVRLTAGEGRVLLRVEDAGAGCAVPRSGNNGNGHFGLFSIRERVGMMEGRFEVDSAPGEGCRVTVMLPPASPPPPAEPGATQSAPRRRPIQPPARAPGDRPLRVLLADDHTILRQGIARLLNDHEQIEVVGEAGDGIEAVELAGRLAPDVVLMDISMPNLNGIEATKRIRDDHPAVRVIGLSMHDQPRMAESILDAGAEAYLQKNGREEKLVSTLLGPVACPA